VAVFEDEETANDQITENRQEAFPISDSRFYVFIAIERLSLRDFIFSDVARVGSFDRSNR